MKMMFFLLLPKATKQDVSPKATKLKTFQMPPNWDLPSPSFFSFFLKAQI